jgi:hypothetical protein
MTTNSKDMEREELIGWCALLSAYNIEYFEKKTTEELQKEYENLMSGKERTT